MVIITKKNTKPRHDNDLYQTPIELAGYMADKFILSTQKMVLDPGCGNGVFGKAVRSKYGMNIKGMDITYLENHSSIYDEFILGDYTKEIVIPWLDKVDVVIGNPPYSLAERFIEVSHDYLNDNVHSQIIFLLKIAFLNSVKRGRGLFQKYPPALVMPLMQRPSFYGNGKTNDYDFAIYVWTPNLNFGHTTIEWADWR